MTDMFAPGDMYKVDDNVDCIALDPIVEPDTAVDAKEVPLTEDTLKYMAKERREELAIALDVDMEGESKSLPAKEPQNVIGTVDLE